MTCICACHCSRLACECEANPKKYQEKLLEAFDCLFYHLINYNNQSGVKYMK